MGRNLHSGNICHQEISIISLYMSVRNVSNVDSHLSWFHYFLYPFPPSTNFCDFFVKKNISHYLKKSAMQETGYKTCPI